MSDNAQQQQRLVESLERLTHVVIKLGTGILTPHFDQDELHAEYFESLAEQVAHLRAKGKHVIVVSSGAVGLGRRVLVEAGQDRPNLDKKLSLKEKQALASIGQGHLVDCYREAFSKHGMTVAQILVSKSDFNEHEHYRNLQNTIDQLLDWGAVPLVNENDAVANEELRYGDNDRISALMAGMYPRTLLVLLTTVDGFYIDDKKVDHIQRVGREHIMKAGEPGVGGSGGMYTKILTAHNILLSGQIMNISLGEDPSIIEQISNGKQVGTWFYEPARDSTLAPRKRWLLNNQHLAGAVTIDGGALRALTDQNASLLAVGVRDCEGQFDAGEIIHVRDQNNNEFAKGIASLGSDELSTLLAAEKPEKGIEVIHRDNLVLL